jgi:hypothetical protein
MSTSEVNKKSLTERDVCTKFITPALVAAGWDLQSQLREEVTFTAGRVIVRGSQVTRGEARRADFVLYYKPGMHLTADEFQPERDWWCKDTAPGRARRKETPFAWPVTLDEIKERNYNLDIKNPNAEAAKHGDPDELLADYKTLLTEVAAARGALRSELEKALTR